VAVTKVFPKKALLIFVAVFALIRLSLFLEAPTRIFSSAVVAAVLFLYTPLLHYRRRGFPSWTRVVDSTRTRRTLEFLFVIGAAVYSLFLWLPIPPEILVRGGGPPLTGTLAANILLLTALPEEVFFRGYLYDAFEEAGWEPILPTSLLFAAGHVLLYATPYRLLTFFPGLLLGWGRKRSGNVYVPIAVHFLYNLFPSLLGGAA